MPLSELMTFDNASKPSEASFPKRLAINRIFGKTRRGEVSGSGCGGWAVLTRNIWTCHRRDLSTVFVKREAPYSHSSKMHPFACFSWAKRRIWPDFTPDRSSAVNQGIRAEAVAQRLRPFYSTDDRTARNTPAARQ